MTKDCSFEDSKETLFYIFIVGSIFYGSLFLFINEQIRIGSFFVLLGIFWFLWINLQLISETKYHRLFELKILTEKIEKMENMKDWMNSRNDIVEKTEDDDNLNGLVCVYNVLIVVILLLIGYFSNSDNNYIFELWYRFYVALLIFPASINAYYAGKINEENKKQRCKLLENAIEFDDIENPKKNVNPKTIFLYLKSMREETEEGVFILMPKIPLNSTRSIITYLLTFILGILPLISGLKLVK